MRPMRRNDRQIDKNEAFEILKKGMYGVLSTVDGESQPYGVPISYVLGEDQNTIYFHGALEGHKLDNITFCSKACFTVIGETKLLPSDFSTDYESAVAFGNMSIIEGQEKLDGLRCLIYKYSADFIKEGDEYIARAAAGTAVFKMEIMNITGKRR